jgi:hypothetical protein
MIRRRTFLGMSSVAALQASPSLARMASSGGNALRYVLIDPRSEESISFARAAAASGAEILDLSQGLTRVWADYLCPFWRSSDGRQAVSGLTSRQVWSCLSEQARGERRRSVFLAHHRFEPRSGLVAHSVQGPSGISRVLPIIATSGPAWPVAFAEAASICVGAGGRLSTIRQVCSIGSAGQSMPNHTSWVIG